ncbi:MAG: hypothetical protein UV73_C0013G0023 [Candidatus Gottesmanbacteria bacterium GW2011_GWA2_43_14]|uniref:Uncharacterized protein n=1 Tax=Candidatus Gottesmanbacteria bacterium GW2011_GWA2_43_14 TaxID=1618443 RepID=A0A0G1GA94_9BACT|nr:MAG: hypothetical protein UV73_C0013G0023 [Candidatus Gottesmanbacteria bacterium GW2011_GWA2_43_14]
MKVYFLDIDDCLIETSRLGKDELEALRTALEKLGLPRSAEITAEFKKSFHLLYDKHQGKPKTTEDESELEKYMDRLKVLQSEIISKWGQVKKWSRECFIYIAAEKYGVKLTSQQVSFSARLLWKSIAGHTPFYPDAKAFLHKLITRKIPFYLISSSDCRLTFDDRKNLFYYEPDYSKKLKIGRLKKLTGMGIPEENIFLGDPFDKPDPRIFRQALAKAKKVHGPGIHTVTIGDSPENDLEPAAVAGIKELVWINRHATLKSNHRFLTVPGFDSLKI